MCRVNLFRLQNEIGSDANARKHTICMCDIVCIFYVCKSGSKAYRRQYKIIMRKRKHSSKQLKNEPRKERQNKIHTHNENAQE